ncbi:MAG: hypothetical protein ABSC57_06515 [Syntrophales bacterium]
MDCEVFLGKSLHNLINAGFRVVEFYCYFVSKLIRVILQYTRDFLQGITYPASRDRSFASWDYHFDYSFSCKKGL